MFGQAALRRDLVQVGRLLYERGHVMGREGNLSARAAGGFLVTPSGACKGLLVPEDLLLVEESGRVLTGRARPSSEWALHREIYRLRPETGAVCHAHPPWATVFALREEPLRGDLLTETAVLLDRVPVAALATPGSDELPLSVRELLRQNDAVLLAHHGVVCLGKTIEDAFFLLEAVERLAQVTLLARLAGGATPLAADELRRLRGRD
jgi:L-fuculose-phosphate aldolase